MNVYLSPAKFIALVQFMRKELPFDWMVADALDVPTRIVKAIPH